MRFILRAVAAALISVFVREAIRSVESDKSDTGTNKNLR